jgi:alpha-L-rhamnosidase/PA14 domain/Chitobiase/beta-hexosaminidase C-terminal domain
MKIYYYILSIIAVVGFCFSTVEANEKNNKSEVNSMKELKSLFKNPPIEYGSAPLWVWNDEITEEQIDQQLIDFKEGGMGGVFIHPRPGLITSYLSDEWFSLCAYTVKKGKELGMNVWLYDENSYPSGFAGGHVPAEMPESYNKGGGLVLSRVEKLPDNADSYFVILKKVGSKFIDITNRLDQEKSKMGDYFLYEKSYYKNQAWHGGYSYVDLLHEGVTEKFIELTMRGYEKYIGEEFGKTVPGIFTDEPNISSSGGLRWTPSLFNEFEKRWGYDLKINLPSLEYEIGDWKRIRHNYYATLLELFIERWSKPWYNYCEKNNLDWTGHYWEHGWPDPQHGGDNMAMYAWHQMPAIDILMNQYSENVNAQFGNVRAVKELSSVANQMGRTRTLSETYGAGGWDLSFEDMKRIGDWEYVLGVNFMNQHLSYMTLEGARKRDHPQSFSYHEPWWKNYKLLGDYFSRLSLALSSGKQNNRILVFEPTSTAWSYFSPDNSHEKFSEIGPAFQNFIIELEKYQIEYDLASENIIKDIGKIGNDKFIVGERTYDVIVFPPGFENMDKSTFELVKSYLKNNGKALTFNDVPNMVDGNESTELKKILDNNTTQWENVNSIKEQRVLDGLISKSIHFKKPEEIGGKLFHHRRDLEDGQILFLANTSSNEWSAGSFTIKGKSVNELDLISGETKSYYSKIYDGSLNVSFDLPPSGSLLLLINDLPSKKQVDELIGKTKIINSTDIVKIKMTAPNVLTLDYCDIKLGDTIEKDVYYFNAADKIFKHHGFDGNPWNRAVQYRTSIIDRNVFTADSGFESSYHFLIDDGVDIQSLQAVVEHPELWQVFVNGKIVKPDPSRYWLDRKFGVYKIGEKVIIGQNSIKLVASPMSVHSELEPIYILGNFSLEPQEKGWKLVKGNTLKLGNWKEQGLPFYSDKVSYTKTYDVKSEDKRFIVKLTDWRGSVADVKVNNKSAGIIAWPPNELDITDCIIDGENEISIIVTGTLKNVLGPHHIGPVRGTAWPASFESAQENLPSGSSYDFIEYGLFNDFVLIESDGHPQNVYWRIVQAAKPVFSSADTINFNSPFTVTLSTPTDGAEIRYTVDGSKPDENSNLYVKPLVLNNSVIVNALSFKQGMVKSTIVQRSYYLIDKDKNGLEYNYYEGNWQKLPEFQSLEVIRKGQIYDFNLIGIDRRSAKFAVEFSGYINIEYEGEYSFYTSSNDGTKLFIGQSLIVDNDGSHGDFERQGKIQLKSGMHPIKVEYFDGGGSQALKVLYKGPGISRQIIPPNILYSKK